MKSVFAAFALAATASADGAVDLNLDNFDAEVLNSGKGALVEFLAPWCGHCKALKPAWKQLGDEYSDSSSVIIGAADCTADGKSLCEAVGVSGYPTIKYFPAGECATPKDGKDYQSGRSLDDLKKFVEENLAVKCDVASPEGCTEKETAYMAKMQTKSAEDVAKQLTRLEGMKGGSMKPDLKKWLLQRIAILKQL